MASTATIITRIRTLIDDLAGDKSVFKENLRRAPIGDQVGSSNVNFQLNNRRIIAGSLFVSIDGGSFAAPTSEDDTRGRFVTATPPTLALLATYDFQFFTDTEITTIIDSALSFVGYTVTTNVPDGLLDPMVKWAAGDCFQALSSRAAPLYDAAAGNKNVRKSSITKSYLDLAKEKHAEATAERLAFFERKGEREAPAYGNIVISQTPYTPIR